ncbi:MAG: FGGY family carbohydrate kinase [Nitrososphaeria archaeon]|jgi:sugar (pentulose or hexulose) kinase
MSELYLGLDIGTKNIKATIISSKGEVFEKSSVPVYDLLIQPREGFSERSAKAIWERTKEALTQLKLLNQVSGLCVDATSGTIGLINKDGNELYNLIMYNDSRGKNGVEQLRLRSQAAVDFEKFLPLLPQLVIPKLIWLKDNFEGFSKTYKVLHESDYIVYKLCGIAVTSSNTAGKAHALLQGEGYLEDIYKDVEIPIEIMPEVKQIGSIVGYTSEEASKLGLPKDIPIVNGITDASAGDVTSGSLNAGQVNVTIGTSLTLHAIVDKIIPDVNGRFYYKTYVNNTYLAGGFTNAGSVAFDSMSRLLKTNLDELTELAKNVPAGSDSLMACTEWFGVRVPKTYPNVKGFLIGMNEKNMTAGHIFRSLLEGSTITLRTMLSAVEEVTGTNFYDLRICGGASKNTLLMQIIADATGKETKAVEEPDSALGSAILAVWGTKGCDLNELVSESVKFKAKFKPNPEKKGVYDKLAEEYKAIIKSLAEIL